MTRISSLATLASTDPTDLLTIVDVSATTTKKSTKTAFLSDVYDGSGMGIGAIKANKADFSVADAAARSALASPFEGLIVYRKDIDQLEMYDGSSWRLILPPLELGRTLLSSSGDTLSVASFATYKYLEIEYSIVPSGQVSPLLRFNADSGANYAQSYSTSFGAGTSGASGTGLNVMFSSTTAARTHGVIRLVNTATLSKVGRIVSVDNQGTNSAADVPVAWDSALKWVNIVNAITTVTLNNAGTGDYAAGTELIVKGWN